MKADSDPAPSSVLSALMDVLREAKLLSTLMPHIVGLAGLVPRAASLARRVLTDEGFEAALAEAGPLTDKAVDALTKTIDGLWAREEDLSAPLDRLGDLLASASEDPRVRAAFESLRRRAGEAVDVGLERVVTSALEGGRDPLPGRVLALAEVVFERLLVTLLDRALPDKAPKGDDGV